MHCQESNELYISHALTVAWKNVKKFQKSQFKIDKNFFNMNQISHVKVIFFIMNENHFPIKQKD